MFHGLVRARSAWSIWTRAAHHPSRPTCSAAVGYLSAAQELELARAVVLAYDLELPLLD
ncbi:hypothetical protein Q6348_09940 [Isoptericola sp. b441]|uniref:Uncharacterized protein n=1 Tax=Actinotalea lenta TaxID=3064654 RepID=A0ABT9DB42_9CELL|nr:MULTISPECIES: hypothetical protein [unclassified Isoptericola]MDO8107514.1 hypothetical protein [Isoptericola sp. b441]MDO8120826.1 hypothetical protein [Isoptericola sp. b490]